MAFDTTDWEHYSGFAKILTVSGLFFRKRWCKLDDGVLYVYKKDKASLLYEVQLTNNFDCSVVAPMNEKRTFLLELSNKNGDITRTTQDQLVSGIASALSGVGSVLSSFVSSVSNVFLFGRAADQSEDSDCDECNDNDNDNDCSRADENERKTAKGAHKTLIMNFPDATSLELMMIALIQAINGAMRPSENFDGDIANNFHAGKITVGSQKDAGADADGDDTGPPTMLGGIKNAVESVRSGVIEAAGSFAGGISTIILGKSALLPRMNPQKALQESYRRFYKSCDSLGNVLPALSSRGSHPGKSGKHLLVCVFHNQRFLPVRGFASANLIFAGDPPGLSDWSRETPFPFKDLDTAPPPDGYRWCDEKSGWKITASPDYLQNLREELLLAQEEGNLSEDGDLDSESSVSSSEGAQSAYSGDTYTIPTEAGVHGEMHENRLNNNSAYSDDISSQSQFSVTTGIAGSEEAYRQSLMAFRASSMGSIQRIKTKTMSPQGWLFSNSWIDMNQQLIQDDIHYIASTKEYIRRRRLERRCVRLYTLHPQKSISGGDDWNDAV